MEEGLARQAIANGRPISDRILNAPQLESYLALYFEAYYHLDTGRNHGYGICKIAWEKIEDYAERNGFDEIQTEDLHYFIRKMDDAVCKKLNAKHIAAKANAK